MEIREVLLELGYKLRDTGKHYRARPIYRDSDNNNSLAVQKDTGRWIDFGNQTTGSFSELIKVTLNLPNNKLAYKWLKDKNVSLPQKEVRPLLNEPKIFDKNLLNELTNDHSYWLLRGINEDILVKFKGGVCKQGQLANRYVFPIFNSLDKVVGFAGRALNNQIQPKWKILGDKNRFNFPLSLNFDEIRKSKKLILVESIGDCLACFQVGINTVYVCFGISIAGRQICTLIKLFPKRIYILFNNDKDKSNAGQNAAEKLKIKLTSYFDQDQISVHTPPKKDLNEMLISNPKELESYLQGILN